MEKELKLSKQEIESLVINFSVYEEAFLKFKNFSQNCLTVLWLVYLLIPATIGFFIPSLEKILLWFMIGSVLIFLKIMPRINKKIVNIYLTRINKPFGHQVLIYQKYHNIIKNSIVETLSEGSDHNYLKKVVIKTLAKSYN